MHHTEKRLNGYKRYRIEKFKLNIGLDIQNKNDITFHKCYNEYKILYPDTLMDLTFISVLLQRRFIKVFPNIN